MVKRPDFAYVWNTMDFQMLSSVLGEAGINPDDSYWQPITDGIQMKPMWENLPKKYKFKLTKVLKRFTYV